METYVLHEIRATIGVLNLGGELSSWRSAAGVEVDVIWSRGGFAVGIEIKSSKIWRRKFGKGLKSLLGQEFINKPLRQILWVCLSLISLKII